MAKAQSQADDLETDVALAAQFRRQIRFWTITAVVIALLLYVFSDILLPFVAGMVLAYFLDPVADRLERLGLSRMMATVVILIAFVIVFVLALMILIPVLVSQFNDFAQRVPGYISQLQDFITKSQDSLLPGWIKNQLGKHDRGEHDLDQRVGLRHKERLHRHGLAHDRRQQHRADDQRIA